MKAITIAAVLAAALMLTWATVGSASSAFASGILEDDTLGEPFAKKETGLKVIGSYTPIAEPLPRTSP